MRNLLPLAAALACCTAALPAQRFRDLRLIDCFGLDQVLVPEHPEPVAWLDGDRYLVFTTVEWQGEEVSTFVAVDAASGKPEVYLPPSYVEAIASTPGMRKDSVLAALSDAEAFHWNEAHDAFVASIAEDLFVQPVGGGPRRLTHTPGEEIGVDLSPDGRMVAFVHEHDLHVVPLDGGDPLPLTDGGSEEMLYGRLDWVYQEEVWGRGNWQGFWWSPDSTRIALLKLDESPVQTIVIPSDNSGGETHEDLRYPTAGEKNPVIGIGVVDVAGGGLRWFDMGQWMQDDPLVVRVTWHPSGEEVFFQVQDREQTWLEMVAADAATGTLRTVFREESPCWVEPGPEPIWIADGAEFLWPSERDGFRHLYRYTCEGELLGRLTEGEFDVEEVVDVDEDAGVVWFLSDRGDWKQRNLFRVGLAGGDPERVTTEDGWHEVLLAPDFTKFVDTHSRAHVPTSRTVRAADGSAIRKIVESRGDVLQLFQVQPPRFVEVPARDGFVMEGVIFEPRGFDTEKKYPVLQFTYSGPHTPRVLDRWRWRDFLWHQRMAQKGYLVFAVDNRSASGQGRRSACAAWRRFGQTELTDLEDAVDWLVAQGYADPERIAIWGWSYGAYQTLYNLTHSRKWAAGIAVNPVTDWRFYDTIYTERYMGLPQTNVEGYSKASVLEKAADLHGSLFLVHSTMDDNVHMRNSLFLIHALQEAGKRFRFMPYPRVRHGIEDLGQQLHLFTEMEAFLGETIGRPR